MIIVPCKQGSQEWINARLGIPTASQFDQIITPKTLKASASQQGYIAALLAESVLGVSLDESVSSFMERGTELEARAVAYYEFERDVKVDRVGFIRHDTIPTGCSPDGVAGNRGIEIKCPGAKQHILNLLYGPSDKYMCQVQGSMWITGFEEWDLLSFHPGLPPALVTIHRDEDFVNALDGAMAAFLERLESARAKLAELMSPSLQRAVAQHNAVLGAWARREL